MFIMYLIPKPAAVVWVSLKAFPTTKALGASSLGDHSKYCTLDYEESQQDQKDANEQITTTGDWNSILLEASLSGDELQNYLTQLWGRSVIHLSTPIIHYLNFEVLYFEN